MTYVQSSKYLSLLVLLLLPLVSHAQQSYALNNVLYEDFFAQQCLSSNNPYPYSCNPFQNSSLWIPVGLPDSNSIVNITSNTSLIVVIPQYAWLGLLKLSLVGNVQFIVQGTINITNYPAASLVVCDTSIVEVNGGLLQSYSSAFYDNSSLVISASNIWAGGVNLSVVSTSAGATFTFSDFRATIDTILNPLPFLSLTNGYLFSQYNDINVNSLVVDGNVVINTTGVNVYSSAVFVGFSYYVKSITLYENSKSIFGGCPNIEYIEVFNASLNIFPTNNSTSCTLQSLRVRGNGHVLIIPDYTTNFIEISNLDFSQSLNGLLLFSSEGTLTTNVSLPYTEAPVSLQFIGNFSVYAGAEKQMVVKSIITKDANVNFTVENVLLSSGFQLGPGLNIILPADNTLYIGTSFPLDSSQFYWEPFGIVEITAFGAVTANEFVIDGGRILKLNNQFDNSTTLQANILFVANDGYLYAMASQNSFTGNLYLNGTMNVGIPLQNGLALVNIYGNFYMNDSAVLYLPQSLEIDYAAPASKSFIRVLGEVNLGGKLNVTLGGMFPAQFTSENYSIPDIPMINASKPITTKEVNSFTGLLTPFLAAYANGQIQLSYWVNENTVYLHLSHPEHPKSSTEKIWIITGTVVGAALMVVVVTSIIFWRVKKQSQKQYHKLMDGINAD